MSGHEKFYIPHDDLQELKTAIESLETAMDTLDASINVLDKDILVMTAKDELVLELTATTEVVDGTYMIHTGKLSTTYDAFLRLCICAFDHTTGSPLLTFDSGALAMIQDSTGIIYLYESVFPGMRKPSCVATNNSWRYGISFPLSMARVPADRTLQVAIAVQNVRIGTELRMWIKYILATF